MDNDGILAPLVTPCLCNDGDGNSAQEGSSNGTSTPSIAPCSCNDDDNGGGGADDGTLALLVVPCSSGNDRGSGVQEGSNDGALASSIFPSKTVVAVLKTAPLHHWSSLACETTVVGSAQTTGHCGSFLTCTNERVA